MRAWHYEGWVTAVLAPSSRLLFLASLAIMTILFCTAYAAFRYYLEAEPGHALTGALVVATAAGVGIREAHKHGRLDAFN